MEMPSLKRYENCGVTLLGDPSRPGGVTFGFSERTGGVSQGEFASLNLGSRCGDEPSAVAKNRALALRALGADGFASSLVEPKQVHGDTIVTVRSNAAEELDSARAQAQEGADAIVCLASGVPVLLCFADCTPVVLVAPSTGAFAVVHSGWRGTLARISAKAAKVLVQESGESPQDILAYIGPHIMGADYEVSSELIESFIAEFGTIAKAEGTTSNLDLSACVIAALIDAGLLRANIVDSEISTATNLDRFYSYRAEHGACGRHAAIAFRV